jgi:uncharacterized protein with FMN-binding domain
MQMLKSIRSSAVWFVLPSLVVATAIGATICSYDPLSFDPSLYQTTTALAEDLAEVVPDEPDEPDANADAAKSVQPDAADKDKNLRDGTYTGYAVCGQGNSQGWQPYYVAVTIEVESGKVAAITDIRGTSTGGEGSTTLQWDAAESQRYLSRAIDGHGGTGVRAQMVSQIEAQGSVSSVDVVSGATFSSEAIAEAYGAALAKAAAAAGSNSASVASTPVTNKPSKANSSGNKGSKGSKDTSKADDDGKIDVEDDEPVEVANLADGSWVGYAVCGQDNEDDWSPYYVSVTVTVKDGKVTDVTEVRGTSKGEKGDSKLAWSEEDNKRYLDWATDGRTRGGVTYEGVLSQVKKALASGTSLGDIDVVSGATYSSNALVKACVAALKKSAEAAGGTYEEPAQDNDGGDDGSDKNDTREDDDADEDDAGEIADDGAGDASEDDALGDGGKADVGDDASDDADGDKTDGDGDTQETEPQGTALVDGEYVGKALCEDPDYVDDWEPYYVLVRIRVEDGSVTQVASAKPDDAGEVDPEVPFDRGNLAYFNRALNGTSKRSGISAQIQAKLPTRAEVSGIDVVSGATFSSRALIEAFRDAFGQVPEASSLED